MTVEQRGGVIIGDSNDHIDEARLISILRLVEGVNGFSIINRRTVNNIPRVTSVGFDKLREANFAFAIVDLNSGKPAAWRMLGYIEAREIPLLVLVGRNDPNFLRMGVDTLEDQIVRQ